MTESAPSLSLELLSDPSNAAALRDEVRRFLEKAGLVEERAVERFVLAVNEAFANIVEHAYEGRDDGPICICLEDQGDLVEVTLRDFGKQPCQKDLCPRELDDLRPGGLGLHFIEAGVDEFSYDTSFEEGTMLHLIKRKAPQPETERN